MTSSIRLRTGPGIAATESGATAPVVTRRLLLARAVYAGDPPRPDADAIVLDGGTIAWVGTRDRAPGEPTAETIDLGDAAVVPGFVDPHFHFSVVALQPGWVDLTAARSTGEVVTRLRRAATGVPEGSWIVGWGFPESVVGGRPRLLRAHLDRVDPERPVLVSHRSLHSGVANSAALAAVGFGRDTPRWPGGELERGLRGEPNGRVWERAWAVLDHAASRAELEALGDGWAARARATADRLLSEGVTTIGDGAASPADLERLATTPLPIRISAMVASGRNMFAVPIDALDGPRTGEVVGDVRVGALKLWADGAERCALRLRIPALTRAARGFATSGVGPGPIEALRTLSPHPVPGGVRTGTRHYSPQDLREIAVSAAARGFSVAIHAIGNEGIRLALDALEGLPGEGHRLEHAMFPEDRDIERMGRMGVTAVVQPAHLWSYGELTRAARLDRDLPPVPLRRLSGAGVPFALSSDAPTAAWEPLRTMPVAVHRRTEAGVPIAPEESIGQEAALRAATVAAARVAGFAEAGCLDPGRAADLVVLSGDPFEEGTRVLETWVGGARRFPLGADA